METSSPQNSPQNGSSNGHLRGVSRSYRRRLVNGKHAEKSTLKAVTRACDPPAGGDAITIEGTCGATTSTSVDTFRAVVESQKSQSSLTSRNRLIVKAHVLETLITDMFSTISALKSAYMHFQSAHVPYDPEKIQIADKALIEELKHLSDLKHRYREQMAMVTSNQSESCDEIKSIVKSYEVIISNLHSELQKKDAVKENLKDLLAQMTLKNEKLERRLKRLEQKVAWDPLGNPPPDHSPTPQLLEYVVLQASEASRNFTKLLLSYMKVAHWDLDAAAKSIEPGINYVKRTHKKFALESYVNHRMLSDFESENFSASSSLLTEKDGHECFRELKELRLADPGAFVNAKPQSLFAKYCLKKFLDVIHPKMEESFFGNMEQRKQALAGNQPSTQFYQSFLKLAKTMWMLHMLAFSFEPRARIFQVQRDAEFSPLYMESIVQLKEHEDAKCRVGFTVMPGFRVERTIIKCQVYIAATASTD